MLRNYYINKEWMVSARARRIYRIAAGLSISLFFLLIAVPRTGEIPQHVLPVVKLLLLAGVLGAATTLVAMEYFLFSFDNSSELKKLFWFCVMLVPLLGSALYCFLVYLRSSVVEANHAKRLDGASV